MKQAMYDIICYVRRDIYKYMLLIAQYTLFFILAGNVILYVDGLKQNKEMFCEKNGYIYVKLVQNAFSSSFVDLWNIPMINEKMEITLEMLKKDSRFLFSSLACNQEINVFFREIKKHFGNESYEDYLAYSIYPGYYNKYPNNKPEVEIYGDVEETIRMAMCKIDKESIEHYDLALSKGRMFDNQDYIYDIDEGKVSVLLGAEYQKYFEVGDTFYLATPIKIMEASVIGFLVPNTNIENDTTFENIDDTLTTLDYSIIMPCFSKIIGIKSEEDKHFALIEYTSNLCGTLIFDEKMQQQIIKDSVQEINDYYLDEGIFTVIPLNGNNGFTYLQGEKKNSIDILQILLFFLLFYNSFVFQISISSFIEKQKYILAIQMINGKKVKHTIISWCGMIFLVTIMSLMFSFFYDKTWVFQETSFHIKISLLAILIIIFNTFLLIKKIKRNNIYEMLWRN